MGTSLALHPVTGPDPESFFARIGLATSYSVPILLVAVGLGRYGHCFAQRVDRACGPGIVLNVGGTAAYLLNLGAAGFEVENWLQLAEINATISALFALGWLGSVAGPMHPQTHHGLQTQLNVACGFFSIAVVGVLSVLWWNPRLPSTLGAGCRAVGMAERRQCRGRLFCCRSFDSQRPTRSRICPAWRSRSARWSAAICKLVCRAHGT